MFNNSKLEFSWWIDTKNIYKQNISNDRGYKMVTMKKSFVKRYYAISVENSKTRKYHTLSVKH